MARCSAPNCHNAGGHLFPKILKIRRKWLAFAEKTEVTRFAVICKAHFTENDFLQVEAVPGLPTPRSRLKPTAVPTVKTGSAKPAALRTNLPKTEKMSFKYETQITTTNENDRKQVLALKVAILSDSELLSLIEHIKAKFMENAPPTAQFPSKWSRHSAEKPQNVREGYPPFSMACLVAMAIESSPDSRANMKQIFGFISTNFPCYKMSDPEWQQTVEITLELYKLFKMEPSAETSVYQDLFYWKFSPHKKTVISPEVYEAFTDPRYDESGIDFSHAIIETDYDIVVTGGEENDGNVSVDFVFSSENPSDDLVGGAHNVDTNSPEETSDPESIISDSITLYKCPFCAFISSTDEATKTHVLDSHLSGVVYCCKHCDFLAPDQEQLKVHVADSHLPSSDQHSLQ